MLKNPEKLTRLTVSGVGWGTNYTDHDLSGAVLQGLGPPHLLPVFGPIRVASGGEIWGPIYQ